MKPLFTVFYNKQIHDINTFRPKQKQTKVVRRLSPPEPGSPRETLGESKPVPEEKPTTTPRKLIQKDTQEILAVETKSDQRNDDSFTAEPSPDVSEVKKI